MSTRQRGAPVRHPMDLPDAYRVTNSKGAQRMRVSGRSGLAPEWCEKYDLPYEDYVGYESAAVEIYDFDPGVVPGLLQTPDYARALHKRAYPRLPDKVIEQRIKVRRIRRQILDGDRAPMLSVIVDEAVLRRVVGGPGVMSEQLAHVIKASEREGISVRVMPFSAGAHWAMDSTFTVLKLAPPRSAVVYVEGLAGHIYFDDPADVRRYMKIYDLLADAAMNPAKSRDLMADVQRGYRD